MTHRRHKYNVAPAADRTCDGRVFASKAEMLYYSDVLKPLMLAGEISDLVFQPRYDLGAGITYVADFEYFDAESDSRVAVDVKGVETAAFKLKKKLWATHGSIPLLLVRRSGKKFTSYEAVEGRRGQ